MLRTNLVSFEKNALKMNHGAIPHPPGQLEGIYYNFLLLCILYCRLMSQITLNVDKQSYIIL